MVRNPYRLFISPGNKKTGPIPSLSFPPILSCREDAPCIRTCYAMKAWRMYPQTRSALSGNLTYYHESPLKFRIELRDFLNRKAPSYFRYFVSGDLPDEPFLSSIVHHYAKVFTRTMFLLFTKRYSWVEDFYPNGANKPDNLKIILSAWPGLDLPENPAFPIAFMQDGNETRHNNYGPVDRCQGNCTDCLTCFDPDNKNNVMFYKH